MATNQVIMNASAAMKALKILERAAAEPGGDRAPLAEVSDNVTGNTPVMYAAMENKIGIMVRMLDLGSDVHAKNKVGAPMGRDSDLSCSELVRFI